MTQEQKTKISEHFDELHTIVSDYGLNVPNDIRDALRAAYLAGADYALDIYSPHWASVEDDELPKEQTNTMRYIDKLICDVEKVLIGLGYKVFIELDDRSKLWCVELLNVNSSEEMPIRHKSMLRGLVKGYLHSFDYFGGTQKIYIYDECEGLHPEDERYSTLEYAMSRVSDNHKNDLFINYGTHAERYVIDNNDKQTVNIAILKSKPQPPILSNSENTGKNHLIDANNMIDHFADISKMVEKGGKG